MTSDLPSPTPRAARILLAAALSLPIASFLFEGVARPVATGFRGFVDFAPYYRGSRALLEGGNPYELGITERIGSEAGVAEGAGHRYLYPPIFGYLSAPLSLLPYPAAKGVWFASTLLALAGSVLLLPGVLRRRPSPEERLLVLLLALAAVSTVQTLRLGQVNLHLLFLAVFALDAANRGRPMVAGAAVGLAAAIKVTPALLLGVFLVRREWRAFTAGSLVALALTLLGFAVAPEGSWTSFREHVLPWYARGHASVDNQAPQGFLLRLLSGEASGVSPDPLAPSVVQATGAARVVTLVVLALTAVALLRGRRAPRPLAFALVLAAIPLASAITWVHHLVGLLPGTAALLFDAGEDLRHRRARTAAIVASFVLVALPLGYDDASLRPALLLPLASSKLAGTLLLWWLLLRRTIRGSVEAPEAAA